MQTHHLDAALLDDAVNRAALDEVTQLLDQGVDPNTRDIAGDPALISAAWVGAPEIVRLLLGRGAEVNAVGADGRNALQRLLTNRAYWHSGHDLVVAILRSARAVE
jgi:ankyrin repeat protein